MTRTAADTRYLFRLYVADNAPNSALARNNLTTLCNRLLQDGHYKLEVVDILGQPELALDDNIIVTPTLLRLAPQPMVRITGNLSDTALVISALGLDADSV